MNENISVKINVKNDGLGKELERIVLAAGGFLLNNPKEDHRPDLLIYELDENFEKEFKVLQSLLTSDAVGEVYVTSKWKDADMLLKAMKTGIKVFLSQPLDEAEVKEALESFKKKSLQKAFPKETAHSGQIIYVMGSKGGVGTTTVAVNLAMKFVEKKETSFVALIDMNGVYGEVPLFLSIKPTYHWGEIVKNLTRLDSTFLMNVLARHPSGIHVLPSPSYLNGHPPVTPEAMEQLLSLMRKTFDYVIIDGGQSLDGPSLKAIEMSDKILFITLLSIPCLVNANKVLKSLANLRIRTHDRFKIVINRFLKKSDIGLKEAIESVRSEIFWTIPNDYSKTMSAINKGKGLHDIAPKAPITKNIAALADLLRAGGEIGQEKKGWSLFKG